MGGVPTSSVTLTSTESSIKTCTVTFYFTGVAPAEAAVPTRAQRVISAVVNPISRGGFACFVCSAKKNWWRRRRARGARGGGGGGGRRAGGAPGAGVGGRVNSRVIEHIRAH